MIGCTNIKHRIQGASTGGGARTLNGAQQQPLKATTPFSAVIVVVPFETVELFSRRSHEISLASAFGATEISKQQRTRDFCWRENVRLVRRPRPINSHKMTKNR